MYQLGVDDTGAAYIQCGHCGRRSYHAQDIAQHYCGACHLFHDDDTPVAPDPQRIETILSTVVRDLIQTVSQKKE